MNSVKSISVVIPVTERGANFLNIFDSYYDNVLKLEIEFEFIIVLTPSFESLSIDLKEKYKNEKNIQIILLNRNYGEAGILRIGIDHTQYDHILTLPPYEQISSEAISQIVDSINDNDAVVVNRWPRIDHAFNRFQSSVFKGVLKLLSYDIPKDPGSGIRLSRKEVFDDLKLYGDLHRFFYLLTKQLGFKVAQIDIPQSKLDSHPRIYSLSTYLSRSLDILTVGFLTRFNQKPLRFFGTGGAISFFIGLIGLSYIAIERLAFDIPAADRPLLVLFSLFLVLGVQLIAIGLVGETIIFTSSKNNKEYRIKKIIN